MKSGGWVTSGSCHCRNRFVANKLSLREVTFSHSLFLSLSLSLSVLLPRSGALLSPPVSPSPLLHPHCSFRFSFADFAALRCLYIPPSSSSKGRCENPILCFCECVCLSLCFITSWLLLGLVWRVLGFCFWPVCVCVWEISGALLSGRIWQRRFSRSKKKRWSRSATSEWCERCTQR